SGVMFDLLISKASINNTPIRYVSILQREILFLVIQTTHRVAYVS
ncbi:MAG: hypothetical protein ACI8S2_001617, partial [Bacteroidia bacterium]